MEDCAENIQINTTAPHAELSSPMTANWGLLFHPNLLDTKE
jgi:hypothetical protein